ncbi:MAG: formyltransferase family protein [Gammaproteobacteria bacterium]|nr:formyltransferase family protein [Gammaproteobacteria bacterium]MDH3468850.1 formyltransferase family protein [Gammaproteobacteria bacterium]
MANGGLVIFAGPGELAHHALSRLVRRGPSIDTVVWSGYGNVSKNVDPRFPVNPPRSLPGLIDTAVKFGLSIVPWAEFLAHRNRRIEFAPRCGLVLCFPQRLPAEITRLPTYGCFNIHPSLLPRYRGPSPLFWQFYNGERDGGVTVHRVTENIDAGPIIAQQRMGLHAGLDYAQAQRRFATLGVDLFAECYTQITAGRMNAVPQHEPDASYYPAPTQRDWIITHDWRAERAYRFICAMIAECGPLRMRIENAVVEISAMHGFDINMIQPEPLVRLGDLLRIRCCPGTITVSGLVL